MTDFVIFRPLSTTERRAKASLTSGELPPRHDDESCPTLATRKLYTPK